jgi:acyl-CoA thioesterase-1
MTRQRIFFWLLMSTTCLLSSCAQVSNPSVIQEKDYARVIRVACVGDSITFGATIENRDVNSYPAQLSRYLGKKWDVRNFGVGGTTLLKQGDRPYWIQDAYKQSLAFVPDVVIIKLGTNDSKPQNWAFKDQFVTDYCALINSFKALGSRIWICLPVPAFPARWGISDEIIRQETIPMLRVIAQQTDVPVIDLYEPFTERVDLFPDLIHPNAEGAGIMAQIICKTVAGKSVQTGTPVASRLGLTP